MEGTKRTEQEKKKKQRRKRLPETAPSNPVLADILHIRCLRQQFVHLVAHIELLVQPEVAAGQLLLDSREYLQCACVLEFPGFVGDAFLRIEDSAFENRWSSVARVVAGLDAVVRVKIGCCGLSTFRSEGYSVWGFTDSQTPVDQGVVDELVVY